MRQRPYTEMQPAYDGWWKCVASRDEFFVPGKRYRLHFDWLADGYVAMTDSGYICANWAKWRKDE